jgi:hypothetical protein
VNECFIKDNDVIVVKEGGDGSCSLAGAAICEKRWKTPDIPELIFYVNNVNRIRSKGGYLPGF